MRFSGQTDFDHRRQDKIGILVTNLGTPAAPTASALRPYLKQFLWDRRVVEIPRPVWWFILNAIILNVRPAKSAKLYESIWTERGSPLLFHTEDQAEGIRRQLVQGDPAAVQRVIVSHAMRYGQPSIESQLTQLQEAGANRILVLPLYPQYSGATGGSTFDAMAKLFTDTRWVPDIRFISSYHDDAGYIDACAERIREHWATHTRADKLIFSYHGVPRRYLDAGDPYYCQCHKTTRLIAEKLELGENDYMSTFQSRFGRAEWLQPYTDETLKSLPAQGAKSVQVFCPGFAADCLETLEEIAEENKEYFIEAGGETYQYISALNSRPAHIDALTNIVRRNIADWLQGDIDDSEKRYQLAHTRGQYQPKI